MNNRAEHPGINLLSGFLIAVLFIYLGVKISPVIALAGIAAIFIMVVLFLKPQYALLSLVALVPLERFGRFTDDNSDFTISLMRLAGIAVLGILLINKFVNKEKFIIDKTMYLYAGYCLFAMLSIVYTTDVTGTTRACSTILANILFFFLICNLVTSRKLVFASICIWLCVSVVIGAYSIYDWYLGSGQNVEIVIGGELDPGKGAQSTENRWSTVWVDNSELESLAGKSLKRSMGSTSHSAVYGINLVQAIPFLLFLLNLPLKNWIKLSIWSGLGIVAYNILLTNTRATILLALIVAAMCFYKRLIRINLYMVLVALVGLIAAAFLIPQDIFNRVLDISNYTMEKSASLRIREEYIFAGFRAFLDNWFLGLGLDNENIVPAYLSRWSIAPAKTSVHNEYLQTLMELGIVGAFFLFSFVFMLLRYTFIIEKRLSVKPHFKQELQFIQATKISFMATLIYGLQVDVFHFPLKGWWLIAGITVFMYRFSSRPDVHQQDQKN